MRIAFPFLAVLLFLGCSSTDEPVDNGTKPKVCTFTNPIAWGQDPYVVRRNEWYYLVESKDNAIYVYRSKELNNLKQNEVRVWAPPTSGWNRTNIWAPELHFVNNRWYIYYAAGEAGPPFIHQRAGVLESAGDDPQGTYTDRGMLKTGDDVAAGDVKWAIDLTVDSLNGQLYAVWSGWEQNQATDKTPQHLYIARMSNPWTIASDRVRISSPVESWERGTELDINEGPQFLRHGSDVFIIYSTRESWLKEYRLGQLRLNSATTDPMVAGNWVKSGPVFAGTSTVFGTGHASFTTSPDSKENWIVYHSKSSATPGWERVIRAQPFTWKVDGSPNFGTPVDPGVKLPVPSGQCNS